MAETSAIEWTDATVNFWWGCTKVGPGCDHCYAEAWNNFRGNRQWGPGAPRRKIMGAIAMLRRLDRAHDRWFAQHGRRRRVFMQSMSDLFDNEVEKFWRMEAFEEAEWATRLDIQLVTKRISNVEKMVPLHWLAGQWPRHIGLIITVVNQEEANRDIPRLLRLKERLGIPWVGLSIEPMLGRIDLSKWLHLIDWVIVGGESGKHARPIDADWVRIIRDQCAATRGGADGTSAQGSKEGTAFLFKQWGEYHPTSDANGPYMAWWGKKAAGRELDGRTHDQFPNFSQTRIAA